MRGIRTNALKRVWVAFLSLGMLQSQSLAAVGSNTFFTYVRTGNLTAVRRALGRDPALIKTRDPQGFTPLLAAAVLGHTAMVRLLLQQGASVADRKLNPDFTPDPSEGNTALHLAVVADQAALIPILLQAGTELQARNKAGKTALHLAWFLKHVRAEAALRRGGAAGSLAFFRAVKQGRALMVDADLQAYPRWLRLQNRDGICPLELAVRHNRARVVEVLAKRGADVNTCDASGNSMLHIAAYHGHDAVVVILLVRGARVDARSGRATPLHIAAAQGHSGVVRLLVANGADRSLRNAAGKTARQLARERGHKAVVRLLGD